MSEIEKARLDLKTSVSLLQLERGEHEAYRSERTVGAIEALIDEKLAEHADRIRAIAREEIEAHEDRLMHEAMHGEINRGRECDETGTLTEEGGEANSRFDHTGLHESPPAVEAPAAGDCPHCDGTGLFRGGRAAVQVPKCPRCYGSGLAGDVGPRNAVEAGADTEDEEEEWYESAPLGTTALACRLADVLAEARDRLLAASKDAAGSAYTYQMAGKVAQAHYLDQHRAALDILLDRLNPALAEARKAGLIE